MTDETPTPPQGGSGVMMTEKTIRGSLANLIGLANETERAFGLERAKIARQSAIEEHRLWTEPLKEKTAMTEQQRDIAARYVDLDDCERFEVESPAPRYREKQPQHKTVTDALAGYFDDDKPQAVDVVGYRRARIRPQWTRGTAIDLIEYIREQFGQDYGDDDGKLARDDFPRQIAQKAAEWLVQVCCPANAVNIFESSNVQTLSADDVAKILKADRNE